MNPAANGECGAWLSNLTSAGRSPPTINPEILHGWGVRPSDWQFGASVQHEMLPRVSVEVGYNRRWFQSFLVTDNLALGPATTTVHVHGAAASVTLPVAVARRSPSSRLRRTLAVRNYIDVRRRLRRRAASTGTASTST